MTRPLKVLISGGGTGGHIFPALSIADGLRARLGDDGVDILFVGALGRMEMQRVPDAGYPIEGLPVAGFDRKYLWRNFAVLFKLWKSMRRARKILRSFAPDIAVGVGGFASGPMLKAAQKAGIPTLLQEQNSYAGVTNKLLARRAKAICTAYPGMERFFPAESIILTGNPIRAGLLDESLTPEEARVKLGMDPGKPMVLVVGGSLGARTINLSLEAAIDSLVADGIQVMWQTGKYYDPPFAADRFKGKGVIITRFITDMATAYRAADLVVARAGAGTISELQLLGKAAILVPSPNVAEDHQRHNAEALVRRDAAEMVLDADAPALLRPKIAELLADPQRRAVMSRNIKQMALANATELITDKIINIVNG